MPKRFKTQYDKYESRVAVPVSNPGDRIHTLYGPKFDSAGHMYLVETGEEDLYDYIQSHAESVDIHVILKRFAQGDVSVLSRVQGTYGDFTQMPKTFAEALNTLVAAEAYFNSLPVDVRARFDHNFNQFIASMDSPTFASDMGMEPPAPVPDQPIVPGQTGASAPVQPASAAPEAVPPAAASAGSA